MGGNHKTAVAAFCLGLIMVMCILAIIFLWFKAGLVK